MFQGGKITLPLNFAYLLFSTQQRGCIVNLSVATKKGISQTYH